MTTCNRCGRNLRSPVMVGGVPFGSTCAQAVAGVRAPRETKTRTRRTAVHVDLSAGDPRQTDLFADDLAYAQRVDALLSSVSLEMP